MMKTNRKEEGKVGTVQRYIIQKKRCKGNRSTDLVDAVVVLVLLVARTLHVRKICADNQENLGGFLSYAIKIFHSSPIFQKVTQLYVVFVHR